MKILIIEDEMPAAERLKKLLQEIDPEIDVIDTLDSIDSSVAWLKKHSAPDLLLMDINLADGLSFEIFNEVNIDVPVIFITAFDQYAIKAFKINSIDYLLKPVKKDELVEALNKFNKKSDSHAIDFKKIIDNLQQKKPSYITRLMIRYGATIKWVEVSDIAYFHTEDKVVHIKTFSNTQFPVDQPLEKLEHDLDPDQFFRLNRQFIVNIKSIDKMVILSKSRVKVYLNPSSEGETIVSSEKSAVFKKWISGESV